MVPAPEFESSIQALVDTLQGELHWRYHGLPSLTLDTASASSPEFRTYGDFLTSPFDDSPFDDFLTTPDISGDGADFLTSPAIVDSFNDAYADMPLFGDGCVDMDMDDSKADLELPKTPAQPDFHDLIPISPDNSPLLDTTTLYPAAIERPRQRMTATGTRRNVTPESLIPLDAPTQSRKYATPSATSRKEVPAIFAKKRARSQAFGDEDDELEDITLPPNPTEAQLIEAKRRQNTIAARRSRKRKLEYTRGLEDKVDALTQEKEMWKARAVTCEALLKNHGVSLPAM
jgi:hypothetical protein